MAPNNPMARFARPPAGPLDDVLRMKRQEEARRVQQEARSVVAGAPKRLSEMVQKALSARLMGRGSPAEPQAGVVGRPSAPRALAYGGMSGMPTNEREVMLRDRREKMRAAFLQRLREDRAEYPDDYSRAEEEYSENASRRGAFLRRAYDAVGTPEGYSDFDLAVMRSQGMVSPLLDQYNEVTRRRVAKEFQRTHKWARKKENLADLDVAVNYLMSRPNFEQSFYYNP